VASFLDALDPDAVGWLHERGVPRTFPPGTALFIEGEASDRVLVLLRGRVKIATGAGDGRETVLAFRGPGEVLGEMSAIDGLPRSASVIAVDPVEALALGSRDFVAFLERTPKATLWILTHVIARLRENDRKRAEFGVTDTMGRVAARLAELASDHGVPAADGVTIDLPITQEELASWVGSSREGVNKALHALKSLGWVRVERRSITVLDLEKVKARAASPST
jgi:CRP/FNR family cyclic AMP-dependent transcriptional regulator